MFKLRPVDPIGRCDAGSVGLKGFGRGINPEVAVAAVLVFPPFMPKDSDLDPWVLAGHKAEGLGDEPGLVARREFTDPPLR